MKFINSIFFCKMFFFISSFSSIISEESKLLDKFKNNKISSKISSKYKSKIKKMSKKQGYKLLKNNNTYRYVESDKPSINSSYNNTQENLSDLYKISSLNSINNMNNSYKIESQNLSIINTDINKKFFYIFEKDNEHLFFYVGMKKCKAQLCGLPFGACINRNQCMCLNGFANVFGKNTYNPICGYKQKLQVIPFILETFFVFGMGHAYLGNFLVGIAKFIALCIFPFIYNYFNRKAENTEISLENEESCWTMLFLCILCIWYIVDVICFGFNLFKDVNNVPLLAWTL